MDTGKISTTTAGMFLNKMDSALLRRKFRGCMLGVLSGDCLGSPYQGQDSLSPGERVVLQKFFDKFEGPEFKAPVLQFTDDSAMTKSLAESLIERENLDLVDIAKRFVKNYYREPNRGYGPAVGNVFEKLRGSKFCDVLGPASQQFNGQGSLGNGGAMRIAPLALYSCDNYATLIDLTKRETQLTHTHKFGINGAILQAITIAKILIMNPNDTLDPLKFIDELIEKMDEIEQDEEEFMELDEAEIKPYKIQLIRIKDMIKDSFNHTNGLYVENVIKNLGNSVTALHSVPTAIFCFLYAQNPIKGINTNNSWRRAIQYAITLGGDTDTIASMTGALAGAYNGDENINVNLLQHCEDSKEFAELGDKLFDIVNKRIKI